MKRSSPGIRLFPRFYGKLKHEFDIGSYSIFHRANISKIRVDPVPSRVPPLFFIRIAVTLVFPLSSPSRETCRRNTTSPCENPRISISQFLLYASPLARSPHVVHVSRYSSAHVRFFPLFNIMPHQPYVLRNAFFFPRLNFSFSSSFWNLPPAVKTIIRNFEKGKNESISFEVKGNAKAFDEEKEIRQDLSIRKIESIIVSTVPGTESNFKSASGCNFPRFHARRR